MNTALLGRLLELNDCSFFYKSDILRQRWRSFEVSSILVACGEDENKIEMVFIKFTAK